MSDRPFTGFLVRKIQANLPTSHQKIKNESFPKTTPYSRTKLQLPICLFSELAIYFLHFSQILMPYLIFQEMGCQ
jgi:hypothetical protein